MKPLQIPPFYKLFVFSVQLVLFPGTAIKAVYASDFEHANSYLRNWLQEQGSDAEYTFVNEVSVEDIHICSSEYEFVSMKLF